MRRRQPGESGRRTEGDGGRYMFQDENKDNIENDSSTDSSFDEIFDDKVVEKKSESKKEEKLEKPASEDKKDITQGEEEHKNDEPPASKEKESWTKTAVIDERKKRQEAERIAKEALEKLAEFEKQTENKRPDANQDPDGAAQYDQAQFEQRLFAQRVSLTRELMKEKHSDYEDMATHFVEMTKADPSLNDKLFNASNPAKFAYETAKEALEIKNLKDPAYKENLRKEIEKEVLEKLVSEQNQRKSDKPKINNLNLTNRASAQSNVTPVMEYKGTLDEVFD